MSHIASSKHTFRSLTVFLAISAAGFGLFSYFFPSIGFTYLEPTYLPDGVSIKEKRILIQLHQPPRVELNFGTKNWIYSLDEHAATSNLSMGAAQQNFAQDSVKPTCDLKHSPKGQQYRLCHWIDSGSVNVYETKFTRADTSIWSRMPTGLERKISTSEIDRYVDSFEPHSTLLIPVLRAEGP